MKVYKLTVWDLDGNPTEIGTYKTKGLAMKGLKQTEKEINQKFQRDEWEIEEINVRS